MGIHKVRDITLKLDGKKMLDNLSIDFREGYFHVVAAPNGAEKQPGYRDIA